MMLNPIDALGTFQNPVAQVVVVVMAIAAVVECRLPARRGAADRAVKPDVPA
ncbi:MAG TPA: hypothetical protein VF065_17220 [Ilumatobacter sp.]